QFAQQDAQQRRLARTVGADQADAVAALDQGAEIPDQDAVAVAVGDAQKFRHELAGTLAVGQGETHLALLVAPCGAFAAQGLQAAQDRKSTRLNSSHVKISYAVFCLKKKK